MGAEREAEGVVPARDPALEPGLRMGGVALANGLVVVTLRHWAAAVREADGSISVASGTKPHMPGSRVSNEAPSGDDTGIPVLRGLERLAESVMVLGLVKKRLPGARLPFESRRVATALAASMAGATMVRALAPRSAWAQEAGTALAAFIPAVVAVRNSDISGYHGAEHKVIGAREEALRAEASSRGGRENKGGTARTKEGDRPTVTGDAASAPKEHDRCGSNLVGPYLFANVVTGVLLRDKRGRKSPVRSAVAGVASLGLALEAMRWASRHSRSILARTMMLPGRMLQKGLTTSEPSPEQLEVGERALTELLRLEGTAVE